MNITETSLHGLYVIEPKIIEDKRGYFFESFNENKFKNAGIRVNAFVQDNQSKSGYGVIRGLHYQLNPHAQTKLVRVLEGEIFDVAVDIREGSPGFGKWYGVHLSAEEKNQLYIPRGFAHGFSVLSETAVVLYKCDDFYKPDAERGIFCFDDILNIDWQIPSEQAVISSRDQKMPVFHQAEMNFKY